MRRFGVTRIGSNEVMNLVSSPILIDFLRTLSELDERSLRRLDEAPASRGRHGPGDGLTRIHVSSADVHYAMSGYYRRGAVRLLLAMPLERKMDNLLVFAKLEAYDADGGQVGVVIPLAVLSDDAVAALHAELRHHLAKLRAGPTALGDEPA